MPALRLEKLTCLRPRCAGPAALGAHSDTAVWARGSKCEPGLAVSAASQPPLSSQLGLGEMSGGLSNASAPEVETCSVPFIPAWVEVLW